MQSSTDLIYSELPFTQEQKWQKYILHLIPIQGSR